MICSLSTLNRNKIPLIPTPHFHPQFSYSLHHDHYCHISMVSSLLPPRHPPMHFYCFQHHQHHISILLSPPPPSPKQPHFSSFPSTTTITTLLLFSHHHNISIVFFSIVSRATLWRYIIAELSRAQRSTTGKKYGNIHRIHKWQTRGKKLVPSHESEALKGKQKLQMKTFSELAECLERIPPKLTLYGLLFK